MAEQEKKQVRRTPAESESEAVRPASADQETIDKLDELLDEIDEVLEENAEEFVKNYVQKGGE